MHYDAHEKYFKNPEKFQEYRRQLYRARSVNVRTVIFFMTH